MHLVAYRLRNFRRLQDVRVDLERDVSVFVGSNNSGKTSATTGVRMFIAGNRQAFAVHDFSAACWPQFEAIAGREADADPLPTMSLDLWFHIDESDVYRVIDLLPSLDWNGSRVGIRIEFAPENQDKLLTDYKRSAAEARASTKSDASAGTYVQWPKTFFEYLEKKLHEAYGFRYYVLNAAKFNDDLVSTTDPDASEPLPEHGDSSGKQVLKALLHVDFLDAQRPLSAEDGSRATEDLSHRLSKFYRHLKQHGADLAALQALAESEKHLNEHFSSVFQPTMDSLEKLGYPGLDNPQLTIKSVIRPEDLLARYGGGTRVHYSVPGVDDITLPDRYNGLGFKNLIYMVVELLEMHAKWLAMTPNRPPVHLVFIEEPEAHLHTQLQQVFIKQIREVPALEVLLPYARQLVVTTHSPHILYHRGFQSVRYFRRQLDQTSQVLNLTTFESRSPKDDIAFLRKYVKLTHCDLFFADAAVLVEGNVERLLLPLMIDKAVPRLASSHLSIIEVSGAFAHRFRGLLEFLGIPALIITDLDSVTGSGRHRTCSPETRGAVTSNPILSSWLPRQSLVSYLLAATSEDRTSPRVPDARGRIHVTYQGFVDVIWMGASARRASRTLEEAFALDNLTWAQEPTNKALGLYVEGNADMDLGTLTAALHALIADDGFEKTDFALALLASSDDRWLVPDYIKRGLQWLDTELNGAAPSTEASNPVTTESPTEVKALDVPPHMPPPAMGGNRSQLDLRL